jgi:hypothetical protein
MTAVIPLTRGSGQRPGAVSVRPGPLDVQAPWSWFRRRGAGREAQSW